MPLSGAAKNIQTTTGIVNVSAAAAPSSGQVLTATTATTATWQTPSGGTPKMKMCTMFDASGRWNSDASGGTATYNATGLALTTTATTTRYVNQFIDVGSNTAAIFKGSPYFTCMFTGYDNSVEGTAYMGMGGIAVAGTGMTFTDSHIGFKILSTGGTASLYGTVGVGGVETATSALTTIASNSIVMELIMVVNSSTSVDFYWRKSGGALSSATTLTLTLPTTNNDIPMQFAVSNNSTANAVTLTMVCASYER